MSTSVKMANVVGSGEACPRSHGAFFDLRSFVRNRFRSSVNSIDHDDHLGESLSATHLAERK